MKLELKHLAPYFPYRLLVQTNRRLGSQKGQPLTKWIGELIDLDSRQIIEHPIGIYDDRVGEIDFSFKEIKPILRPLSDLTKEIVHNGEKFVPLEKLFGDEWKQREWEFMPYFVQHTFNCSNGKVEPKFIPYWIVEKLFEWHFNVFNLPEHLWIDINTLKK